MVPFRLLSLAALVSFCGLATASSAQAAEKAAFVVDNPTGEVIKYQVVAGATTSGRATPSTPARNSPPLAHAGRGRLQPDPVPPLRLHRRRRRGDLPHLPHGDLRGVTRGTARPTSSATPAGSSTFTNNPAPSRFSGAESGYLPGEEGINLSRAARPVRPRSAIRIRDTQAGPLWETERPDAESDRGQ